MKLNPETLKSDKSTILTVLWDMLVQHFNYSIADINSYSELTDEEKKIIPEDIFNEITIP